ncbi:MAG: pitrilysin family protein [Candidatus Micrarchaeia archaeon]
MPVVTIFIATKFGAAYEAAEHKGVAHFIEHMLFKGTKKRNSKEISSEIEKVGGEINAFTSEQMTGYYTKTPRKHFEKGFDVLSDMLYNSIFAKSEIEKERTVIFEEIKRRHDNPSQYVLSKLKEVLYSAPFGLPRLGTLETVSKIKRKQILDYYNYYSSDSLVIAVVGAASWESIREVARSKVKGPGKAHFLAMSPNLQFNKYLEMRKNLQQAHLALGFHTPTLSLRERYAAEIFDCILGKGMSSRLWQEIREKRGLAYTVHSYLSQEKSYGYESIYVGTKKEKIKEVKEIIIKQIKSVQRIDLKEVEEAKENLIGSHDVASEKSDEIAMNLLLNEIASSAEEYYRYSERISEVKPEDVRKIARIKGYSTVTLVPK